MCYKGRTPFGRDFPVLAEVMNKQGDYITITVRSFVMPDKSVEGFDPGKPCRMNLFPNTTLADLITKVFLEHADQIGLTVVNGEIASKTTILSQGDKVDLYELLGGG